MECAFFKRPVVANGARVAGLDNRLFKDGSTGGNAIKVERAHIQRPVRAVYHNLGGTPTHRRRLLQPVPGKPVQEKEVPDC